MFYKLLICIVEKNFTCLRLNLLELVGKRFKNWPKMYQIRHHQQLFTLEIHEYFFLIFFICRYYERCSWYLYRWNFCLIEMLITVSVSLRFKVQRKRMTAKRGSFFPVWAVDNHLEVPTNASGLIFILI